MIKLISLLNKLPPLWSVLLRLSRLVIYFLPMLLFRLLLFCLYTYCPHGFCCSWTVRVLQTVVIGELLLFIGDERWHLVSHWAARDRKVSVWKTRWQHLYKPSLKSISIVFIVVALNCCYIVYGDIRIVYEMLLIRDFHFKSIFIWMKLELWVYPPPLRVTCLFLLSSHP